MNVETLRLILERTFEMPVAESDAQIVLNRLNEISQAEEAAQHQVQGIGGATFPASELTLYSGVCSECGSEVMKPGPAVLVCAHCGFPSGRDNPAPANP